MSLVIDTREPQPEIWDILASIDIEVPFFEFKALDVGDYLIQNGPDTLLLERKTVADFTANYGELKDRMDRMRQKYDRTALVLEGSYMVREGNVCLWRGRRLCASMKHQAFHNFIASQQARGSYFYCTTDLRETIMLLCYLHDYLPKMGMHPARKTKSAVEWLAQLPGVGMLTAFALRDKYQTPDEAIAMLDDWLPPKAYKMLEKW